MAASFLSFSQQAYTKTLCSLVSAMLLGCWPHAFVWLNVLSVLLQRKFEGVADKLNDEFYCKDLVLVVQPVSDALKLALQQHR